MTIEQLRNTYRAELFRPFAIHMADGRRFVVPHRDFIAHSPPGRTVIVFGEGEAFSILDLLLMTEVEFVSPTSAASNGGESQHRAN
jgi:hypothetical protein